VRSHNFHFPSLSPHQNPNPRNSPAPPKAGRGNYENSVIDRAINWLNENYANATVFQTDFTKRVCLNMGMSSDKPNCVIGNAPDHSIFSNGRCLDKDDNRKFNVIMSSWSSNARKGFDIYSSIDRSSLHNKFNFTFIGNSRYKFDNILVKPPMNSNYLAKELRKNDFYITASVDDPCSNSFIEAQSCGLFCFYRLSGGHSEIARPQDCSFRDFNELREKLTLARPGSDTAVHSIEMIADSYLNFFSNVKRLEAIQIIESNLLARAFPAISPLVKVSPRLVNNVAKISLDCTKTLIGLPDQFKDAIDLDTTNKRDLFKTIADKLPVFLHQRFDPTDSSFSLSSTFEKRSLGAAVFAAKIAKCIGDQNIATIALAAIEQYRDFSYHDPEMLRRFIRPSIFQLPRTIKLGLSYAKKLQSAEARQALAVLPKNETNLNIMRTYFREADDKIDSLTFKNPWADGSHFSHWCFYSQAIEGSAFEKASDFIAKYRKPDGFFYSGAVSEIDKINGLMKVLTGLNSYKRDLQCLTDWESVIEICLKYGRGRHACDTFNVIYVLMNASQYTNYKHEEVKLFAYAKLDEVLEHYWSVEGGFSFHKYTTLNNYLGVRIGNSRFAPDLHGTVMFVWAMSLLEKMMYPKDSDNLIFREMEL
jgi:hypothetical protein